MKNKVLIRALITSILAFMLYSVSLRQLNHAKLRVIEPQVEQKNKKQQKEPQVKSAPRNQTSTASENSNITVEKGSQKKLVSKIESVMGKSSYQVAVQDLNNSSRYARLATTSQAHSSTGAMRLIILATIYRLEQKGSIKKRGNVKIKKADRVKGEKMLQTNMQYSIAYLRQAMMNGNKTAANALLRKAGKNNIEQTAQKFGAIHTVISGSFTNPPVGKTTASDLDAIFKGLYQGRVLRQQYAQIVLMAMSSNKTPLTSSIHGTIYSVGDSNFAGAIVQSGGHSYCISSWGASTENFQKLGKVVHDWINKNH